MKARPIIMSAESVRALLAEHKTQTRRVVNPQPVGYDRIIKHCDGWVAGMLRDSENAWRSILCPYGQPGDLLYVRETFATERDVDECGLPSESDRCLFYAADSEPHCALTAHRGPEDRGRWRPSIHMPRWASRLTLELTDVGVERIQDISERGATDEGVNLADFATARMSFAFLWQSLNAKRGFSWESNPWVWKLTFIVHKANVDAVLENAA